MIKFSHMSRRIVFPVLLIIIFIGITTGCSRKPALEGALGKSQNASLQTRIVNSARLAVGGKLFIQPLRPGAGVLASDESEKMALMFVKGITERLKENQLPLEVVSSAQVESADFLMKGHITRWVSPEGFKVMFWKKNKMVLGIEGRIIEKETQNTVFLFSEEISTQDRTKDGMALALELGQQVGQSLIDRLERP